MALCFTLNKSSLNTYCNLNFFNLFNFLFFTFLNASNMTVSNTDIFIEIPSRYAKKRLTT